MALTPGHAVFYSHSVWDERRALEFDALYNFLEIGPFSHIGSSRQ